MTDRRLAVVGMALKMPGADTVEDFWELQLSGRSMVRRYTRAELVAAGLPGDDPDYVGATAPLDGVDLFDAGFFGMSHAEARMTDPQHRLFLEVAHHALEDAGYAAPGERTAVFAGAGYHLFPLQGYLRSNLGAEADAADQVTGLRIALNNHVDFVATRTAFKLGLTGPAMTVQTACSTGLSALHQAALALATGDADIALVGAAAVHVPQVTGYRHVRGTILSRSGYCRSFDAGADGTVCGNGVGALVVKRLADAERDGDRIHAVVLGVGVNNDGDAKRFYSAPSGAGQTGAIRRALELAEISARQVGYVETHGTGTIKGDPIEFAALAAAHRADTADVGYCAIGSGKPVVGHHDSAAAMAGLFRAICAVKYGRIPPLVNYTRPNPTIHLDKSPFRIPTEAEDWGGPRIAGVSAFGIGGTNTHAIIAQAPESAPRPAGAARGALPLSAADPEALRELAAAYAKVLRKGGDLPGVLTTARYGRRRHPYRLAAHGESAAELADALDAGDYVTGTAGAPVPVYAYTGQGSPYRGMGRALYDAHPAFREIVDAAPAHLREAVLYDDGAPLGTDLAQPALFVYQAALTALLRDQGAAPALVTGHSVGEFAALHAAGALSFADGVRFTEARGRLMAATAPGKMLALRAASGEAAAYPELTLAAVNGPESIVLAGPADSVDRAAAHAGSGAVCLDVDRAFHTPLLDPILDEYRAAAASVAWRSVAVPFVSSVDGETRPAGWTPDADYFVAQARRTVRFDAVLTTLAAVKGAHVIEIGPRPVLTGLVRAATNLPATPTARRGAELAACDRALAELYVAGVPLTWGAPSGPRGAAPLYPYRRERHWVDAPTPSRTTEPTMPQDHDAELLALVTEAAARQLGRSPATTSPDMSFAAYGADSLLLVALTRELEVRFGVRVSMRELFEDANTSRKLAALVAARRTPEPVAPTLAAPAHVAEPAPVAAAPAPAPAAPASVQIVPAPPPAAPTGDVYGILAQAAHQLALAAQASAEAVSATARVLETATRLATAPLSVAAPAPEPKPQPQPKPQPRPAPKAPVTAPPVARLATAATPLTPRPNREVPDFGLYFFGDYPDVANGASTGPYAMLREAARFADANGFSSVWLPERHFDSFGGLFPNPSVLAAAIAADTKRVRINAGSVVLPLHDTIRVVEEWSMVDGLSGGRVGIGVAPGWHPNDFVFHPERFAARIEVMYEQLAELRGLWFGAPAARVDGSGNEVELALYPRPVQAAPPMYTAVVGNPESYRRAAAADLGVVTNLMTQTPEQLAENIALYRQTRAEHGLDPAAGRVTVLMHTYLGPDAGAARDEAFGPFRNYLNASLKLFGQMAESLGLGADVGRLGPEDLDYLFRRAYGRYCDTRALIGSPASVRAIADAVVAAGADEIAALVDFGMPAALLRKGLPHLSALRDAYASRGAALTPAEERVWLAEQIAPEQAAYNEPRAIALTGPLDVERLRAALDALVARHPALRTVFVEEGGLPVKRVTGAPADFAVEDAAGSDEDAAVRRAVADESVRRFDLANGPLFVTRLLRFGPDRHALVMSFHHIIVDAVSATILTRDLSRLYKGEPLPPLGAGAAPPDPGAVAADMAYWAERLSGDLPVLELPTDRPRPAVLSASGQAHMSRLSAEVSDGLRRLARDHSATVYMTLLAGLAVTLRRFTGQDEVVIGAPIARRPEGAENVVGFLVNTLALRLDLSGDPTFAEVLGQVRRRTLEAYDHAEAPFEAILRELRVDRDLSRNPVFQAMAEYKNAEAFVLDLPGVTAEPLPIGRSRAMTDVLWHFTNAPEGIGCHLEYATDLFDARTAARIAEYLDDTLATAAADPSRRISALALTRADRDELERLEWGAPAETPTWLIHERFAERSAAEPGAVAVVHRGRKITYGELAVGAARLAHRLRERGAAPGKIVAVCTPRDARFLTAIIAVLHAGAAYLPIDPAHGAARVASLLNESRALFTVTAGDVEVPGDRVHLDDLDLTAYPATPPAVAVGPDDRAAVVYTSGSTGKPKGVVLRHAGLAHYCAWYARLHRLTPADRSALVCSFGFDGSMGETWPALTAGASLAIADEEDRRSSRDLARWYAAKGVTISFIPTPLGEGIIGLPRDEQPPLRVLIVGGDALRVRPAGPLPYELFNAWGPSETTVWASVHPTGPTGPIPVPIGTPMDGAAMLLRDPAGRPVPVGVPGEIHVAGPGVSVGYLHAPDLTAERFTVDAATGHRVYRTGDLARWNNDGALEFLGRVDDQVKIRGFRVEPGEVTAALRDLPFVSDAAVIAVRDGRGDAHLHAHVVGDGARLVERATDALAARLPEYLVPRAWTVHHKLPATVNGKVDKRALAAPAPAPGVRDRIEALWREHVEPGGPEESFFSLGGHSVSAMRLLNSVREEFSVEYPSAEFYRRPTIAAMAERLGAHREGPVSIQQRGFLASWDEDPARFNVPFRMDVTGAFDPGAARAALDDLATRHESLRTRFHQVNGEWRQTVLPPGGFEAEQIDLRGPGAEARADELAAVLARRPVDLPGGRPLRVSFLRLADDRWRLVFVVNHVIGDGWAVSLIMKEFAAFYTARVTKTAAKLPPAGQSIDVALREQAADDPAENARREAYWVERLRNWPITIPLPYDLDPAEAKERSGRLLKTRMSGALTERIRQIAAEGGVTPFALLATAFGVHLSELSGQRELLFNAAFANRRSKADETVVSSLAVASFIQVRVDPDRSLADQAAENLAAHLDGLAHHRGFFPVLNALRKVRPAEEVPPPPLSAHFQYQSTLDTGVRMHGLSVAVSEVPAVVARGLVEFFVVPHPDAMEAGIIYDTDRLSETAARAWLDGFVATIDRLTADPHAPVGKKG